MNVEEFFGVFSNILKGANVAGVLDGNEFESVSLAATSHRALIAKGWVNDKEGPAIRFRAAWGDLEAGEVLYQNHPSDNGWQETADLKLKIDASEDSIALVMNFVTTVDGNEHEAIITADISMQQVFANIWSK